MLLELPPTIFPRQTGRRKQPSLIPNAIEQDPQTMEHNLTAHSLVLDVFCVNFPQMLAPVKLPWKRLDIWQT